MSKPWSGAGAWAADAERADAEAKDTAAAAAAFGPAAEAFPTLGEAVSAKPQKKKKNQAISLSELVTGKYVGPGGGKTKQITDTNKLTPNEMMMLPTGPRDRSDEEPQYGGLGGGFKDYGGYRGGGGGRDHERGDRDRDGDRGYGERSRDRGFGGGFEREKAAAGYDGPSRADETDDWGATKKFVPSQGGGGYDDDRRGGRSSDRDLPSRADEVENWGSSKKFTPSNGFDRKSSGFGFDDTRRGYEEAPLRRSGGGYQEAPSRKSGYEEAPRRSGGFEDVPFRGLNSRADEAGDWGSTKKFVPSSAPLGNRGWDSGPDTDRWSRREQAQNGFSNVSERPRLVLQPRSRNVDDDESLLLKVKTLTEIADATQPKAKSNPFGAARPREDVLAEKGQDWRKIGSDLSTRDKDSRPSSSHSSRPATPDSSIDLPVKPRPRVNPFGNAKPREVLLQEKGKDWRKIDFELEHKSVDRPLSEEEKKLKEEIDFLLLQLTKENDCGESENEGEEELNAGGEKQSIKQQLHEKERELEQLTRSLDDKVRFSQRGGERPLSRSGRSEAGTGRVYEPPRGEGKVADVWTRQSDVDRERGGRDMFDDMPRRR